VPTAPPLAPLRDRIRPGVRVLFVGINPGLRSAATGHHFAGYSNRFWKLLYESRLVDEPVTFLDDDRLPGWGFGITNLVARPTAGIDSLSPDEYRDGRRALERKIVRYRPALVALVGVTLCRALFGGRSCGLGLQRQRLAGAEVFVLPNPSGRNAHFSHDAMKRAFIALKKRMRALDRRSSNLPAVALALCWMCVELT
jgi:TDG/mug DNA glycosylase family protein